MLIKRLFNKIVTIQKTKTNTAKIEFRSKAIFLFLTQVCGIKESPKQNVHIPLIIIKSSSEIKKSFLRGIADTDFSITFKKEGKYPVLDHQTPDKILHTDLKDILLQFGFRVSSGFRNQVRNNKILDSYYIQISGREMLSKWINEIGFSSYNHIKRYNLWKESHPEVNRKLYK